MDPRPEGYGEAERVRGDMAAHELKISSSATLADLARDYAIFNHGAFFVYGRLDVDPVADYVNKHEEGVLVMPTTFPRRVFHGLSAPGRRVGPPLEWDRILCFVEHRWWGELLSHLECCGWVDRRRKSYGRAVVQRIPVVDQLAVDKALIAPSPLPTVEVFAFGVDGTNAHVQFRPRVASPHDVATATHLPLLPETKKLGDALLSCDPRPFRFVEPEDPYAGHQGIVPPAP